MSSNQNQIHEIIPGGPDPQPNITGSRDQVASDGAFVQDRVVDPDPFAAPTSAEDTMTGATSADVYESAGKPGSGMTSAELHHDGQPGRKKQGLAGEQWGKGHAWDLKREGEKSRDIQL